MPNLETKDGLIVPVPDGATETQKRQAVAEARASVQKRTQSPKAAQQTPTPGALSTAAQSFGQGASFGFSDELSGALQAAVPSFMPGAMAGETFGERYRTATGSARDQLKAGQRAHPTTAALAEIAGGFASGFAGAGGVGTAIGKAAGTGTLGKVGLVASQVPRWMQYGAAGAGAGALAGAGYSDAETLGGVAADSGKGAALGGALGTVAQPLGRGVAAAGGWVGGKAAPVLSRLLPPQMSYKGLIKRGMELDQTDADEMIKRLDKLGPDALPFEIGDESLQGIVEAAANAPGPTRAALTKRFADRALRSQQSTTDDLYRSIGLDDADFSAAVKESQARARQIGAYFDPIVNTVRVELNDTLKELMQQKTMKRALDMANERVRLDILGGKVPREALQDFESFASDGIEAPTLRTLWYIRRGLDDIIGDSTELNKKITSAGQKALQERKMLNDELSKISPEFRDVSRMYADEMGMQESLTMGRKFMREDADITSELMDGLSEAEKNMFRIGAGRALRDRMVDSLEAQGANVRTLLKTTNKERIRTLFDKTKEGKESYEKFINSLEREMTFAASKQRMLGGSQTARRQAVQNTGLQGVSDIAYQAGRGDPASIQGAILRDLTKAAGTVDPRIQQQAAMFLQRPENKQMLIDMLRKQQTAQFQRASASPTTAGYVTALEMGRQGGK